MHTTPNRRGWASIHRAQVFWALAGFAITVAACTISSHLTYHDDAAYPMLAFILLLAAPAALIFKLLGIKLVLGPETGGLLNASWYTVVVLTNMVMFALMGTVVVWLHERWKTKTRNSGDA